MRGDFAEFCGEYHMAENENVKSQAEAAKKITKYDQKMQKRKEIEAKKKKEKKTITAVCVIIVIVIVALIAWKCVSNYQEKHGTYFQVGDHKIEKEEYDYYMYTSLNSFLETYGSYAQYFGLDVNQPLDQQFYMDNLTWKDYFDQQAAEQIRYVHAVCDEAKAQGFEYDPSARIAEFETTLAEQVASSGMSEAEFLKSNYGDYAKKADIEGYLADSLLAGEYYNSVKDSIEITEEDVQKYYDENSSDYDSLDYMVCKISADMPEAEEGEEVDEAQKEAALAEAKAKAEEMKSKVTDELSFAGLFAEYSTDDKASTEFDKKGDTKQYIFPTELADWLYDTSRKAGDVEVIPYESANAYYVVYFKDRYLNHEQTMNVRHILIGADTTDDMTDEEKAQVKADAKAKAEALYAEWQAGEATEDSFAAMANENSTDPGSNTKGGLYENVKPGQMVAAFNDWCFDPARQSGDTGIVETDYGYHIMYFVDGGQESWYASIETKLVDTQAQAIANELITKCEISDPAGHLTYLEKQAAAETETAGESEAAVESEAETEAK